MIFGCAQEDPPRLFERIRIWDDRTPGPGPMQMAVDDALSEQVRDLVVLRHYCWEGRWASLGRSQSVAAAAQEAPGFALVRRPTGGGVVRHAADWTFCLWVPSGERAARLRPREFYRHLHLAVAQALAVEGAHLADPADCLAHVACFEGPALFDVLDASGKKLCGGAQRRTRTGILHQGSIQNREVPEDFLKRLARATAVSMADFDPPVALRMRSAELAANHYGSRSWTERIP